MKNSKKQKAELGYKQVVFLVYKRVYHLIK